MEFGKPQYNSDFNPFLNNGNTDDIVNISSEKTGSLSWIDIVQNLGGKLIDEGEDCNCDVIGISLQGNIVDEFGGGVSVSIFDITNGQDRGIYSSFTPSIQAGEENSFSTSIFKGYYMGDAGYPSLNDFLGKTVDAGLPKGQHGWVSFNSSGQITWGGYGQGFTIYGNGVSAGYGYTKLIYGFKY